MSKCYKGEYKTNAVVTHRLLICFGGFGEPSCKYLEQCCKENGIRKRKKNIRPRK